MNTNEHGASYAFNRTWTSITSVKNGKTWFFRCGCGEEKEFSTKNFVDPREAAIASRESHICTAVAVKAIDQIHTAAQEQS